MPNSPDSTTRAPLLIFSPLPPERNGIADYCAALLPGLQAVRDCTVVVADGCWQAKGPEGVSIIQSTEYENRRADFAETSHLFHIGNNPGHVYMLDVMSRTPGLVVLHDPGLHHLVDSATLARGDEAGYAAALVSEYGWAGRVLAEQFMTLRLREERMLAELPMIRGVLGPARGVIVHSATAAEIVRRHAPGTEVSVVNHHVTVRDPVAGDIRVRLGIGPQELLIVSLGFVTRAKQIDLVLRALADVAPSLPPFRYLVAGEIQPGELDVLALAAELGIGDHVLTLGYVTEDDMAGLMATADLLVNLRYPTSGETSGTLMRALARGVCTIVTHVGAFRDIPDGAVLRLPWTNRARQDLGEMLLAAATDSTMRGTIGAAAARWCREECSVETCVAGYLAAIEAMEVRQPIPWLSSATAWETRPRAALGTESGVGPLWYAAGLLPEPDGPGRALALLADPGEAALLAARLGWAPQHVQAAPTTAAGWDMIDWPAAPRSYDLAILSVPAGLLPANIEGVLNNINALLGFGGMAVLEVTGGETADHPLLNEDTGRAAFDHTGYAVEATASALPASFGPVAPQPSRRRCWRVLKVSEFRQPPLDISTRLVLG